MLDNVCVAGLLWVVFSLFFLFSFFFFFFCLATGAASWMTILLTQPGVVEGAGNGLCLRLPDGAGRVDPR
jgi:hypothetical protein